MKTSQLLSLFGHKKIFRLSQGIVLAVLLALSSTSFAQYRNAQIGVEGGYFFLGDQLGLSQHNPAFGLRGGFKSSDHWWLSARGLLAFPGEEFDQGRTTVLLHLVPIDARYYFETDAIRPFAGITNSFQFIFNRTADNDVMWGPGVTGGSEFRLDRDLFLGVQADLSWMFVFEGPDIPILTVTSQFIFFL